MTEPTRQAKALSDVGVERLRQDELFARGEIPWDCADPSIPAPIKLAVLVEEVGEVARAMMDAPAALRTELIQVAAVAVAWAEAIE